MRRTGYASHRSRRSNIAAGKLLRSHGVGVVRSLDWILSIQETKLDHQIPHTDAHAPDANLEDQFTLRI